MALSMRGRRTVFRRESESLMVRHHRRGKERDRRRPLTNKCMAKVEQSIRIAGGIAGASVLPGGELATALASRPLCGSEPLLLVLCTPK